jgi:hypothetical protein
MCLAVLLTCGCRVMRWMKMESRVVDDSVSATLCGRLDREALQPRPTAHNICASAPPSRSELAALIMRFNSRRDLHYVL